MLNNKANILGIYISRTSLRGIMECMSDTIENRGKLRLCVNPVNNILWGRKDEYLKKIYNSSDINLADGVPVVWASKFLGEPINGRATGLDMLPEFSKIACEKGFTFFFLGAKEGVAAKLAEVLREKNPGLNILGFYSPPFAERFSEEENSKMIEMINAVKPNVLWVSLTAPKQDIWIYENFEKLDINVAIGVGGAFEVTAGLIPRAPVWMQKNGLEWFYRFSKEPKRLFRRYIIEAPRFIPLVIRQKFHILKF